MINNETHPYDYFKTEVEFMNSINVAAITYGALCFPLGVTVNIPHGCLGPS